MSRDRQWRLPLRLNRLHITWTRRAETELLPVAPHKVTPPFVYVRADSEQTARHLATAAFGVAVEATPKGDTHLNPWSDPARVACAVIPATGADFMERGFTLEGPEAVLWPAAG